MNTFATAVKKASKKTVVKKVVAKKAVTKKVTVKKTVPVNIARTDNGMVAQNSTSSAIVDLFYKIGAMRGKDIIPDFERALNEDVDLALRVAAWSRDIRGGAGERETFRNILRYLDSNDIDLAYALMKVVPELGRWDDLLVFTKVVLKRFAYAMIKNALNEGNGLCAKWMPRKGPIAVELREAFGWSPKHYRKTLVELTNVVETAMCNNEWDGINFSHVPSVASARYKKAFYKHTSIYAEYVAALVKGDDPKVKVNASAIFPHDVLKGRIGKFGHCNAISATELALIEKQWDALPNYIGDNNILPLVDVSGSMIVPVSGITTALEIAVSLGLYCADKNKGTFNGTFLTFSGSPELIHLKGKINEKIDKMVSSNWGMNTDLHKAFNKILTVAEKGGVPPSEMPQTLLILSDMQFDSCIKFDHSAYEMIESKYEKAGYKVPNVVFWNLNASDNVPVGSHKSGAALVSGYSPAICASILGADPDKFTPAAIMLETIMKDRYKVL